MSHRGSKFGDFLTGAVVGGVIGYVVALLNAPARGEETRQMLTERGKELKSRAVETVQSTLDKTGKMVEEGRARVSERVEEVQGKGSSVVHDAREQVSETMRKAADRIDPDLPV